MLSLCEPCLTRSLAPSLSLSHPHTHTLTHTQIPTETCHPQQKPPKLILTRSCPAHQRTTHIIGIIDQSLTFWWKQEEKKSIRVIHFFFLFVLSAADIPQQLHVSLTHNIMLGQQKSVIVCAVMAKGKRANMQDIYHPRRYMRVCVCVCVWVYVWTPRHKRLCMCSNVGLWIYWSVRRYLHGQIHRDNV